MILLASLLSLTIFCIYTFVLYRVRHNAVFVDYAMWAFQAFIVGLQAGYWLQTMFG